MITNVHRTACGAHCLATPQVRQGVALAKIWGWAVITASEGQSMLHAV